MFESSQNWQLFGYDVRHIGKQWRMAWREFLWGHDSPIKARFDDRVLVHGLRGDEHYHAGARVPSDGQVGCEAIMLPDSMVLTRTLTLPLAAWSDLESVMALEINAHSPFPPNDTACGWRVLRRDEQALVVLLVLVSQSATMAYLGRSYDCHDPGSYEVWAEVDGQAVVLGGFGEKERERRYRRRLTRVAGYIVAASLAVLSIFAVAAGAKYVEMEKVRATYADVDRQAQDASRLRSALASASETINGVAGYVSDYPDPHRELARLTRLLGDDAFIQQFSMEGPEIRFRGQAANAAKVMEQLTAEPAYAEVTAPQTITKLGNSDMERFVFKVTLAGESP